jgi:gluconokinase
MMKTRFVIVMGVAGCGKTTVGEALAEQLGWQFYDADGFHPAENVAKMANGTPLTDSDRAPWLAALHALISTSLRENHPAVLACSALKESYRQQLLAGNEAVQIVYLKGSYELIWSRISKRKDHYMKPNMLKSQFEALEEPRDALTFDVSMSVNEIVQGILAKIVS